jgi:hypothetical protein
LVCIEWSVQEWVADLCKSAYLSSHKWISSQDTNWTRWMENPRSILYNTLQVTGTTEYNSVVSTCIEVWQKGHTTTLGKWSYWTASEDTRELW